MKQCNPKARPLVTAAVSLSAFHSVIFGLTKLKLLFILPYTVFFLLVFNFILDRRSLCQSSFAAKCRIDSLAFVIHFNMGSAIP